MISLQITPFGMLVLSDKRSGDSLADLGKREWFGDDIDDLFGKIVGPFALFGIAGHQQDFQTRKSVFCLMGEFNAVHHRHADI